MPMSASGCVKPSVRAGLEGFEVDGGDDEGGDEEDGLEGVELEVGRFHEEEVAEDAAGEDDAEEGPEERGDARGAHGDELFAGESDGAVRGDDVFECLVGRGAGGAKIEQRVELGAAVGAVFRRDVFLYVPGVGPLVGMGHVL